MKEITFRFNTGCQPYLYDCYVLIQGYPPIKLGESMLFMDVICDLAFLVNPLSPESMNDTEFAQHLLELSKKTEYSFTFKMFLIKEFLQYNANNLKLEENGIIIKED